MFSSPHEIGLAISLGELHFNQGFNASYTRLLPQLGIQVQPKMCETWRKIDLDMIYQADYKGTPEVQKWQMKKIKENLKTQDPFVHQETIMYQSRSFHSGERASGTGRKARTRQTSNTTSTVSAGKKNKKAGQITKKGSKYRSTKAKKRKSQTKK